MEIIAEKRTETGKKSKKLREFKKIPAVMFGKHLESLSITIGSNEFTKVYRQAGETSVIDLVIDGKKEAVLVKDVQEDPITLAFTHVGFYKVNLKEKITAQIPVHIINDDQNPLVKSGEGLALVLLNEITVEALPTDLPHSFTIDVSKLANVGDSITIAQLDYDRKKVELVGYEETDIVVKIDSAHMAEEEVVAVEVTEAEAIAAVAATKELTEEEKAKRAEEEKAEKAKK